MVLSPIAMTQINCSEFRIGNRWQKRRGAYRQFGAQCSWQCCAHLCPRNRRPIFARKLDQRVTVVAVDGTKAQRVAVRTSQTDIAGLRAAVQTGHFADSNIILRQVGERARELRSEAPSGVSCSAVHRSIAIAGHAYIEQLAHVR